MVLARLAQILTRVVNLARQAVLANLAVMADRLGVELAPADALRSKALKADGMAVGIAPVDGSISGKEVANLCWLGDNLGSALIVELANFF